MSGHLSPLWNRLQSGQLLLPRKQHFLRGWLSHPQCLQDILLFKFTLLFNDEPFLPDNGLLILLSSGVLVLALLFFFWLAASFFFWYSFMLYSWWIIPTSSWLDTCLLRSLSAISNLSQMYGFMNWFHDRGSDCTTTHLNNISFMYLWLALNRASWSHYFFILITCSTMFDPSDALVEKINCNWSVKMSWSLDS